MILLLMSLSFLMGQAGDEVVIKPSTHGIEGMIPELRTLMHKSVQQEQGAVGVLPGVSTSIFFEAGISLQLWGGFSNPTAKDEQLNQLYGAFNFEPTPVPAGTRIEPTMLFEAASITKMFTAAAILRYADLGSIELDDSLKEWLPLATHLAGFNCCCLKNKKCRGEGESCPTIRQLMNMTSGIPDFNDGIYETFLPPESDANQGWFQEFIDIESPDKFWLPGYVYDRLETLLPTNPPGKEFHYSSTNYVILGTIGNNLANYFNLSGLYSQISAEAGLTNIYLGGYDPVRNIPRALGWNDQSPGHARRAFVTAYWSAGGTMATASDCARWAYMLQQPGVVLSEKSLEEMRQFTVFDPPECVYRDSEGNCVGDFYIRGYGLGLTWFQIPIEVGKNRASAEREKQMIDLFGHSGGSWAFLSFALYDPRRNVAYAMMVNKKSPEQFTRFTAEYARIVSRNIEEIKPFPVSGSKASKSAR